MVIKIWAKENVDCNIEDCDSIIQSQITGALDYQELIAKLLELGIDVKFEE